MKNKLFADALIVMVLFMLPDRLVAGDASANSPAEQNLSLERTCEQPIQLIPMLMGHASLAQFASLGLQFPEETLDPVKQERVTHIRGTQHLLKLSIPCLLNRSEATCGGKCGMSPRRSAGQRSMSI